MGNESHIGRAKTILVSGEGPAVITVIIAKAIEEKKSQNLIFSGNVHFDESVKEHIHETILPHVDDLTRLLNITPSSYELTAVNIGAVSSSDIELSINGFSADVSIFMAMLSAGMKLPLEQNIVYTGHIASKEGDISQVKDLEAKSKAAVIDEGVSTFVYSSLDSDSSLKILKPKEYENSKAVIRSCRGKIKLLEIHNTYELIKNSISDQAIVSAALTNNFFEAKIEDLNSNRRTHFTKHFLTNNKKRFWNSLQENLFQKKITESHELMNLIASYYVRKKKYPEKFGEKLYKLILSLPLSVRKTSTLFPLLGKADYFNLIQNANKMDHNDITYLHNALYGEIKGRNESSCSKENKKVISIKNNQILDYILEQIDPDFIDTTITRPLDEARSTFILEQVKVDIYEELLDVLTAFYIHLYRNTYDRTLIISKDKFSIEALDLFHKTFPSKTDTNEAIANGLMGSNGGLRLILDKITDYLINETRNKHILTVIHESINPLNYELKKQLIDVIIRREEGKLNINEEKLNPEKYVENYIEIIKAYASSKQILKISFNRL